MFSDLADGHYVAYAQVSGEHRYIHFIAGADVSNPLALKPSSKAAGLQYVLPTGDDSADGLSWGSAKKTLSAALGDLPAAGGEVRLGPAVFTLSAVVDVNKPCRIVGCGRGVTTLKKANGVSAAIRPQAADITIENLTVDGNRTNGSTNQGITWNTSAALRGILRNVEVKSNAGGGVRVLAGAELRCYGVESSDNVSGTSTANGFFVDTTGKLICDDECRATGNDRFGFFFDSTAADGCRLGGYASRNLNAGASIRSKRGTIGRFIAEDNTFTGLAMGVGSAAAGVVEWNANYVEARDTGKTDNEASGTGVELYGVQRCRFGTIVSRGQFGYGLALAKDTGGGSLHNSIGVLLVDHAGAADNDPGVHFSGGSQRNYIGIAYVKDCTFAVSIGEGVSPGTNDYNVVGSLYADGCTFGIVKSNGGSSNRFGRIVGRDCRTLGNPTTPALVYFTDSPATSHDNVVDLFDHKTISVAAPNAIFAQAGGATGNYIRRQRSPDPLPANVAPGASPYTYVNADGDQAMIVKGGVVTLVELSRDGATFYDAGVVAGVFPLSFGDSLRVTYTGVPTMTKVPAK